MILIESCAKGGESNGDSAEPAVRERSVGFAVCRRGRPFLLNQPVFADGAPQHTAIPSGALTRSISGRVPPHTAPLPQHSVSEG